MYLIVPRRWRLVAIVPFAYCCCWCWWWGPDGEGLSRFRVRLVSRHCSPGDHSGCCAGLAYWRLFCHTDIMKCRWRVALHFSVEWIQLAFFGFGEIEHLGRRSVAFGPDAAGANHYEIDKDVGCTPPPESSFSKPWMIVDQPLAASTFRESPESFPEYLHVNHT